MASFRTFLLASTVAAAWSCAADIGVSPAIAIGSPDELPVERITLPEGFEIAVFARVDNARSMALGPKGTVFVGNRKGDTVWAVRDDDGDSRADRVLKVADGLDTPNGVAVRDRSEERV